MRRFIWNIFKRILFRLDPEVAHHLAVRLIQAGIRMHGTPLRLVSGASSDLEVRASVFGMDFRSPIGLAAGFDKNGEILSGLASLGFGFAEVGTVTPRPQPGNDRPRLFRDPKRAALFNRMGFNNLGAAVVSRQVARHRENLPSGFRVGINIGKNKETALSEAATDYVEAARYFRGLADYIVVNVSSPNTPGLRDLQAVHTLRPIIVSVDEEIRKWSQRPPLLLKLAPELCGTQLYEVLDLGKDWGINGWVLSNTLAGSWPNGMTGGWSGAPLADRSMASLIAARGRTQLPIISVGGISTPEDVRGRKEAGADLIQIYTGWIYQGPSLAAELSRAWSLE